MSFNKIIIVGNLGRDPELKYTPQGTAMCKLSLATSEKRKDQNGDTQDVTTWFRVTVWGRQAELCNEYLAKGRQCYIEGRLRLEEYTDREGGKRTSLEVNATDVQFIGARGESDSEPQRLPPQDTVKIPVKDVLAARGVPHPNYPKRGAPVADESDVPF